MVLVCTNLPLTCAFLFFSFHFIFFSYNFFFLQFSFCSFHFFSYKGSFPSLTLFFSFLFFFFFFFALPHGPGLHKPTTNLCISFLSFFFFFFPLQRKESYWFLKIFYVKQVKYRQLAKIFAMIFNMSFKTQWIRKLTKIFTMILNLFETWINSWHLEVLCLYHSLCFPQTSTPLAEKLLSQIISRQNKNK